MKLFYFSSRQNGLQKRNKNQFIFFITAATSCLQSLLLIAL
jgi:hypothetical protein